jgi:hypothetical protein
MEATWQQINTVTMPLLAVSDLSLICPMLSAGFEPAPMTDFADTGHPSATCVMNSVGPVVQSAPPDSNLYVAPPQIRNSRRAAAGISLHFRSARR